MPDPHRVLGVEPGAGPEELRAAFRRALRRSHPDTAVEAGGASVDAIVAAYRSLASAPSPAVPGGSSARDRPTAGAPCGVCGGRGLAIVSAACPDCGGSGGMTVILPRQAFVEACRRCRGRGVVAVRRPCMHGASPENIRI